MSVQNNEREKHNVLLYDRSKITITGVKEVSSFDEEQIVLFVSDDCVLTVEGTGFNITVLDLEKGSVEATGEVFSLYYSNGIEQTKSSLFSKIFRGK